MSTKIYEDGWNEQRLVASLKAGNEAAYRILVRRYQAGLYRLACGITLEQEESLDIVQEVFLKAFRNMKGFKEEAGLSTWLHRITVNECLNWKRTWKRRFRGFHRPLEKEDGGDYPELGTENDDPETLYTNREMESRMENLLGRLSEQARAVFVLKEMEGRSYEEIAEILKIKPGTVSSRLFHARKKLQAMLKQKDI